MTCLHTWHSNFIAASAAPSCVPAFSIFAFAAAFFACACSFA